MAACTQPRVPAPAPSPSALPAPQDTSSRSQATPQQHGNGGQCSGEFYFAWQDIFGGSNNDFSDLITSVEGVECSDGGEACDTGQPGICEHGITTCEGEGIGLDGRNSAPTKIAMSPTLV